MYYAAIFGKKFQISGRAYVAFLCTWAILFLTSMIGVYMAANAITGYPILTMAVICFLTIRIGINGVDYYVLPLKLSKIVGNVIFWCGFGYFVYQLFV